MLTTRAFAAFIYRSSNSGRNPKYALSAKDEETALAIDLSFLAWFGLLTGIPIPREDSSLTKEPESSGIPFTRELDYKSFFSSNSCYYSRFGLSPLSFPKVQNEKEFL